MFDVLIREVAARFGIGDKALPLVQMLLAYMTQRDTGGLMGFLEKFKAAGLGPIVQSWLGGGPAAQPVSNSQLETVLGGSGGLLSSLTSRLNIPREGATAALGYLLPAIVGKLTPGGSIPSALPPEVTSLAAAGQSLWSAPAAATRAAAPVAASGGGMMKWLPWIIVALAALFGLNYCSKSKTEAPAASAPASAPAAEAPAAPAAPASDAMSGMSGMSGLSGMSGMSGMSADEPAGSAVVSLMADAVPALKVYFDSGKTDVAAEFADKSKDLVGYLKANAGAKAVISGFNDPTGDPVKNAELSKNRAKAVQAALVAAGLTEADTVLEKPAETTGTGVSNAASRRVEVTVRK